MRTRTRCLAGTVAAFALGASASHAQEVRPDTLARMVGRSVEELVAGLPGEPVGLEALVATALDRNLDLEVARAQRHLADAALQTERGLFDPALVLGWGRSRTPGDTGPQSDWSAGLSQALPWGTRLGMALQGARVPGAQGAQPTWGTDLALTFQQPLLEGFGTLNASVRAARAGRRGAAATLLRAQESVAAEVELGYWDLAESEAIQAVLLRSMEIAEALLFRNVQLAERELVPEVDVITARSGVALRRAGVISARRAREDAAERLVYLAWGSGAPERLSALTAPLKTEDAPPEPPVVGADVADVESRALDLRQDVTAARAAMEASDELRREARRAVLPALTLDGSLGSSGEAGTFGGSLDRLDGERSWSLGLSLSQPLLNRRDRGLGLSADLAVELRRLELELLLNQVRFEVRGALRALAAGRERLAAAEEAASLARAQLEAERRRLDLGLGDSFRLLETEENAVQAELEEVRARYDLARAATYFRLAAGAILPG